MSESSLKTIDHLLVSIDERSTIKAVDNKNSQSLQLIGQYPNQSIQPTQENANHFSIQFLHLHPIGYWERHANR